MVPCCQKPKSSLQRARDNARKFRLDGLLRSTGEWIALKTCDDRADAQDLLADCSDDLGWVYTEDAHINSAEFAAYRIVDVVTISWYPDLT